MDLSDYVLDKIHKEGKIVIVITQRMEDTPTGGWECLDWKVGDIVVGEIGIEVFEGIEVKGGDDGTG